MTETPTYVYGVAAAGALNTPLRAQGMPDGQSPVTAIAVAGASAIIGRHVGPAMSGLSQPELLRRLTIHQRVIEDALERGDVLPAQFGTVLASEDEVRMLLTGWGKLVRTSLEQFSGLVEVEVAATWDLQRVLGNLARDPEVMKAKSAAAQAPPEERLAHQVNVGKIVKEALDRRRARCQQMLLEATGPLAERVQPNALLSDELVFNVAFLLRRSAMTEFEAAIDRLDAELAGSYLLRVIGPLPPYTFGTVNITRFDAERLAAGRAILGLAGEISEQAVLSRYRQLAREFHPDHQQADSGAVQRFAALSAARADLLAYAQSRAWMQTADGPALTVTIGPAEQCGRG
jgi:Gas vesicle synthesis protein GvpL/GvpF/DnaJ domain